MSVQALTHVLEHSKSSKGARCVMFSLANHADAGGGRAFPSVETIANEANMSKRAARAGLRKLEEEHEIVATGVTRWGTIVYAIVGMSGAEDFESRAEVLESKSSETSAKPSTKTSLDKTSEVRAREACDDVFDHWIETSGAERRKLTQRRRTVLLARLREFKPDEQPNGTDPWAVAASRLKRAIDGACADPWVVERGLQLKFDYIFRNEDRVDQLIGKAKHGSGGAATERAKVAGMEKRLRRGTG